MEAMTHSHTYTKKLTAITLGLLAVVSPIYVDRRRKPVIDPEDEIAETISVTWLLPLVLVSLIAGITLVNFVDRRYLRFDPYWIHRVGGSSFGIAAFLFVLCLVLKLKSSFY